MANYAEEIKNAINSGASVETVKSLNDQRNAKISANSDYYGSKGISSQDNIATMAEDYINAGSGSKSIDAYTAPSYRNVSGSYSGGTASDYSNYLRELYAQKEASDLAALKSAYDKNISSLQAAREQITPTYQAARNETAAQNEIARQGFNEYAAARGLNTGTSGQAELTRSAALQSNLANLLAEEKNALTENQRQQDDLLSQYNSAVAQAKAGYGTELAQALYNELVRQDQANQSLLQYSESAQQAKADAARQTAMTAINLGVVPSESLLQSAGMSLADAQAMADAVKAANAAAAAKKVTSGSSRSGGSGNSSSSGKPTLTAAQALAEAKDGRVTQNVLDALAYYYGDDYYLKYYGSGDYSSIVRTLNEQLSNGRRSNALAYLDSIWPNLSSTQQTKINELLGKYGIGEYVP